MGNWKLFNSNGNSFKSEGKLFNSMGNWIKCKGNGFMVESSLQVWEIGSKVKIMGKWLKSKGK